MKKRLLVLCALAVMSALAAVPALAEGYISTYVNMYEAHESEDFHEISYTSSFYVPSGLYISGETVYYEYEAVVSFPAAFLTTANTRIRYNPSLDSGIIKTVPTGSVVQVLSFGDGDWYTVEFNGTRGYMYADLLIAYETDSAPYGNSGVYEPTGETYDDSGVYEFISTANLRLRTGPSLGADITKTVPRGATIRVLDTRDGQWYAVEFNGIYGYMYADFLLDTASMPYVVPGTVEVLPWSYARTIFRHGVPTQITDVRTGITYWVTNFSSGSHADVRPVSPADTDAILRTFNGRWSWNTRPIWVHIDGRTIAASINGMPHGSRAYASVNNMNGHLCIHFYGSRTHNGNRNHERDHQNAVQEALRASRS